MTQHASAGERNDELGQYFLARLERLVTIRRAWMQNVGGEPPELLELALASTYADCVRLGLAAEPRACCGISDDPNAACRGIG